MNTDTKLKNDLDWMDAPIESDKWCNIFVTKSGKSYRGCYTHPSEEAALASHLKAYNGYLNGIYNIYVSICGARVPWEEHSYTIQMPE